MNQRGDGEENAPGRMLSLFACPGSLMVGLRKNTDLQGSHHNKEQEGSCDSRRLSHCDLGYQMLP